MVYSIVLYIYQVNTISCFTLFATIYQHQESYKDVDFCIQNEQVEMKMPTEARTFPFSMIVGQKKIKEALVLLASNPRIGSVVISGENGTGKSVLAKAVHKILPQTIERVKDSFYNIDPTGKYGVDSSLVDELNEKDMELKDLEVEEVPTPFVQIPLNVMEDSLIGKIFARQLEFMRVDNYKCLSSYNNLSASIKISTLSKVLWTLRKVFWQGAIYSSLAFWQKPIVDCYM